MADLRWSDVLSNPQAYPDEMLLRDLGADIGQQLIDARKTVVPRDLAQRQYQRAEVLAEEKRALEQQLAQALTAPPQGDIAPVRPPYPIDYTTDPLLGPLHRDSSKALELATTTNSRLDDITRLQQQLLTGLSQIPLVMRIEQLKQQDPGLDPARLLEYNRERLKQPDLADAYRLMTYDSALAKAKEAGMAAGLEQAKQDMMKNPPVPYAPYGPAQSIPLPQPSFQTMEAAEAAALQDPDIIGSFYSNVG